MNQPEFWFRPPGTAAALLAPLAGLWSWIAARKLRRAERHSVGAPVISIGNIVVGGAGKTPTAIAVAERLADMGRCPHFVSRGYGGSLEGPIRVDPDRHRAAETGDEPLLLAAFAPAWVSRDRAAGARAAAEDGASEILLDDGHQNGALNHDLSLVVADAKRGFGNGRVMPAGPLREPIDVGLARADAVILIGSQGRCAEFRRRWGAKLQCPVIEAALRPLETGYDWKGARLVAFAGIGHPAKFFATLEGLGATVAAAVPLSDHQPLTEGLLARINALACKEAAQMVTTEKDAARLPRSWRSRIIVLPVRLEFRDPDAIDRLLRERLP